MRHPSPPTGSPAGKTGNWQAGYGGYNTGYNGFNGSAAVVRPGSTSPHVAPGIYPPPPLLGPGREAGEEATSDNNKSDPDPASDKDRQQARYSPAAGEKDDYPHNGDAAAGRQRVMEMEHMMPGGNPLSGNPSELKAFPDHPSNTEKAFHNPHGHPHQHEDPSKLDTFDNRSQHAQHVLAGGKSSPLHAGTGHGSEGDLYCHAGQVPPLAAIEGMQASQEAEFMSMQQHHTMQHHHSDGGRSKYVYRIQRYD